MYLSKNRMIDAISEQLVNLSKFVLIKNQLGYTDINKGSEDFFCHLLNMSHRLQLQNMNEINSNYPAIDLGDKNARVCFQVTSENTKRKIESTIDKFKVNRLHDDYDCLVFLIISDKKKPKIKYQEVFGIDVLNVSDVLSKISNIADVNHLEKINDYISQNLQSSVPACNSILSSSITPTTTITNYDGFLLSLNLNLNDESDQDYRSLIINALNKLQNIIFSLSKPEREYIFLIVKNGKPESSRYFLNEAIIIPVAKINMHLNPNVAAQIFQALSPRNIVNYLKEYQPYDDSPYVPSIEVNFSGDCETNLFFSLKKFTNSNDGLLRQLIINNDFSVLC
jgi:hypothetical protein